MVKLEQQEVLDILGLTNKEPCQWCSTPDWNIYHNTITCPLKDIFTLARQLAAKKKMKIYVFKNGERYTCSEFWGRDNIGFSYPGGKVVFKKNRWQKMK